MAVPEQGPLTREDRIRLIALGAAVTSPGAVVGAAPFDSTLTGATYAPDAAITGATATKRTMTLVNRGQDGSGAVVMATLDFITGTNGVAGDELAFTLSGTPANLLINAGDVLAIAEAVTSTGTANPGGLATVRTSRR